jgi:mRNA-degrading endonuclease toxin of MazEF toxin-antitoxin module
VIKSVERGDIIHLDLDPTKGNEQQGKRFALVLTPKYFNDLGLALVAPITTGGKFARDRGFAVPLFETKTIGVILTNRIRTIDIKARVGQIIEKCPKDILIEALARVQALVDFEE